MERKATVDWLLEIGMELFKAKRDHCETICEKITNRNILPNQFSALLPIFSGLKRGGAEPPKFSFREASAPPAPPPSPPLNWTQSVD